MKLSPNTTPLEPADLLIRMHNLVGAAVDVTGRVYGENSRWACHGCGFTSGCDVLALHRGRANAHASQCRAAYHHLR
ncbi:hypothetical protein FHS38_005385 [Streptomyces netropsis]|uniref:Uncharacterized protein n=1 Tax=Streptomyces netropsis TaxID=55404 RepID=A0A7W7PI12_STRNE|nr:hypothetical protein [Streptomyces netropsis]GGR39235.1 hypothetical protein GCM10010219_50360 [Streptomyces netropsis]